MTKLILTTLLALFLGLGTVAPTFAGPLGQPWDTITKEGQ